MATSQDFVNWVCGKHIDWRFLKYVLLAEHESYSRFAHGTTHQTIYFPEVKAFHVCLPPVAEQRRIVGVLGALDDKIECSLDLSRHLFQAARLEYTRVARQSPQDEVGRLARILSGKRPVGEVRVTPTASADVPVLGGAGVMGYTDRSLFDEQVLVTGRVGTLGLVHLVNGKCWPSDNTLVLKRASDGACLEWLVFSLEDADLGSLNRGSTQPLLTQSALREVLVPVPDPLHAELYERFAGRLFRLMDHLQREVELLKRLRDELLPKVVSGAIRVPEDYEPAT
jgi:type I restriction enzyme S subunit